MFVILLINFFIQWASTALVLEGPCPNVTAVPNFNLTAFANGTWYEYARYPNEYEERGDCALLLFKKIGDKISYKIIDVVEKHKVYFDGFIDYQPNANGAGILNYYSTNYKDANGNTIFPVHILVIDYNHYAIGYECKYDKTKNMRYEYAWVATRSKAVESEAKNAINNFIKSTHLIDESKFMWMHFTEEACKAKS